MLVLSESASTAIRSIVDRPERPDVTGVRITGDAEGSGRLRVSAAGEPDDGDQVVEDNGARVFLEPTAAEILDDKVLDATVDDEGRVAFVVDAQ